MKAVQTGYVFVMITLLTLTVVLAIAAFYPAPKRYNYPKSPSLATDFNSPEYQEQQKKYQQDLENYQQKNMDVENQRKIWGENNFITLLIVGAVMLGTGLFLINSMPLVSISLLFSAFIVIFFGSALTSYYADSTTLSLLGGNSQVDLTRYKQIQFVIALIGTIFGGVLSSKISDKTQSS